MANTKYSYKSMTDPWSLLTNSADTVTPGQALYFDSGTKTNRPITSSANGRYFSGVAMGQNSLSGIDNDQITVPLLVEASKSGIHSLTATNGETLDYGDPLYMSGSADANTVIKAAPGGTTVADIIGYYMPEDGASVTIANTTTQVQVQIRLNFPTTKLG